MPNYKKTYNFATYYVVSEIEWRFFSTGITWSEYSKYMCYRKLFYFPNATIYKSECFSIDPEILI